MTQILFAVLAAAVFIGLASVIVMFGTNLATHDQGLDYGQAVGAVLVVWTVGRLLGGLPQVPESK